MKFDDYFFEPQYFTDETYVLHGELSIDEAIKQMDESIGLQCDPSDFRRGLVRFGFPGENVVDYKEIGPCWHTGASKGKGSKEVWIYE